MNLNEIRKKTIVSLFSDDYLADILSLKGGNALEIAYDLNSRASIDIDVSMERDFSDYNLSIEDVKQKIEDQLKINFKDINYKVFDVKLSRRPLKERENYPHWGGYNIEFKIIDIDKYKEGQNDIDKLRRSAEIISESSQSKKIKIDISKYEFTQPSEEKEIDDFIIRVYTPIMIVYEKLRAICQQMPEYKKTHKVKITPRARDFYDIWNVIEKLNIREDILNEQNIYILKEIFGIKKVPLSLLKKIEGEETENFHKENFIGIRDITKHPENLETYNFYYRYVVDLVQDILKLI